MPPKRILEVRSASLGCAAPPHRQAMRHTWRAHAQRYFEHRQAMRWAAMITPYWGCTPNGGCKAWALPAYIVACESGGDYFVGFGGAYGLLEATWQQWGGTALVGTYAAGDSPPWAQDVIAHRVWISVGPSGWACA